MKAAANPMAGDVIVYLIVMLLENKGLFGYP
jgi:hypothetical protein